MEEHKGSVLEHDVYEATSCDPHDVVLVVMI